MKKICFITTSRADFGMVNIILEDFNNTNSYED